jgi:hypothetical protein
MPFVVDCLPPPMGLLRLSEKSVTRKTATIYGVYNEQYTLYVVYYEVEKHFSDSLVMRSRGTLIFLYIDI